MTTYALPCKATIGSIEIAIAPVEYVPAEIDAIVEEQDTQLLMGMDAEINYPDEDFDTLIDQMLSGKSVRSPGQIIIKKTQPLQLKAIIHDINQKPSWKTEWISYALQQLVTEIENYNIKTLAMPLLGTIHGNVNENESIELLCDNLMSKQIICLEKLWLIAPDPACSRIKDAIEKKLAF